MPSYLKVQHELTACDSVTEGEQQPAETSCKLAYSLEYWQPLEQAIGVLTFQPRQYEREAKPANTASKHE